MKNHQKVPKNRPHSRKLEHPGVHSTALNCLVSRANRANPAWPVLYSAFKMRNIVAILLCQVQAQLNSCNDPMAFLKPYKKGSKCGAPTRECFDEAVLNLTSKRRLEPWSKLENGTFHKCNKDDCVGFKLNENLETMFLCSMHLSYYSPRLNPNTNYVGLTIAAVKKDGKWYYNNGEAYNPNKKFM